MKTSNFFSVYVCLMFCFMMTGSDLSNQSVVPNKRRTARIDRNLLDSSPDQAIQRYMMTFENREAVDSDVTVFCCDGYLKTVCQINFKQGGPAFCRVVRVVQGEFEGLWFCLKTNSQYEEDDNA